MGLLKFLAVFFLIYLIVRFFRTVFGFLLNKSKRQDTDETFSETKKEKKIFSKDDGEYVDYEELD